MVNDVSRMGKEREDVLLDSVISIVKSVSCDREPFFSSGKRPSKLQQCRPANVLRMLDPKTWSAICWLQSPSGNGRAVGEVRFVNGRSQSTLTLPYRTERVHRV